MRKLLLAAVLFTATALQAQVWNKPAVWAKSLTPVDNANQLGDTHTAVAADGAVFTTGTYNQNITFGGKTFANDDKITSAYVAKYNADGSEAWLGALLGMSAIRTLDTDAEGNLYVAGVLADEVTFYSADGHNQTVHGAAGITVPTTTFIAKYDKDGNLKALRSVYPVANPAIVASGLYSPEAGDVRITPGKLMVSNGRVYLSATYTGDVTLDNVQWEGRYLDVFSFMYSDVPGVGILSLNADDLTGATSVANLKVKENKSTVQQNPESVSFTVDGSTVYAGFVGKGVETLTTPGSATDLTMQLSNDETGNVEHAFILAKIDAAATTSKIFHVAMHDKSYGTDRVGDMILSGGKLYVGGSFYNQLGFDTSKTSTGSSDLFVASLNPADFSVNWAANDGYDEGDVSKNEEAFHAMLVNDGKLFIAGVDRKKADAATNHALTYNLSATGAITPADNVEYISLASNATGVAAAVTNAAATTTVSVYKQTSTGIATIKPATDSDERVYNLNGQYVGTEKNLPRGIYIRNGKKIVVK